MRNRRPPVSSLLLLAAGAAVAAALPAPGATLSDIAALAGDPASAGIDHTEPSIAVNPLNPRQIAVVAFSGSWGPGTSAPVWKSDDGGATWRRVPQLPEPVAGQTGPSDQKIAFDRNGSLYVAELGVDSMLTAFDYIYRQSGAPDAVMAVGAVYGDDQPHLDIDKAPGSGCLDRLYSPWLDFSTPRQQSTVENSTNFGAAVSAVVAGDSSSFNNRTTRIALAPDGKAYIVYKTREGAVNTTFENAHFRVQRSDDCGVTWNALGAGGSAVTASQVQTYFTFTFGAGAAAQKARSSDAWIAVDPRSGDVYVSYVSKDASGFAQIYVARSSTQGAAWTSNRVTDGTHNSAFPEIAVTHHGTIGVLYVDFDTAGATTTYRHRFSRSNDLGVSWADEVLQSMDPTGFPNLGAGGFTWGDYEGLTAAGTSFYGVFTGASIGRPTAQMDPIFFSEAELPTAADFYVRDWTTSPALRDDGAEPSTNPAFFATSDVWNRRSNSSGAIAGGVPPDQENPWDAGSGHNYAFARISRNTGGVADTVTAHLLYADYGMGSNFTPIAAVPGVDVPFAAGDLQLVTAGLQWDLPAVHSPHVCMAVEIHSASGGDPVLPPDLETTAPGPADPLVVNDNDKAQRNMAIYPALGEASYYAVIHEAGLRTGTVRLRFALPRAADVRQQVAVRVIAPDRPGDRGERMDVKDGSELLLRGMRSGENRWLEITAAPSGGGPGQVMVEQLAAGHVVNGFGLALRPASLPEMIRANADFLRAILFRIEALHLRPSYGAKPGYREWLKKTTAATYHAHVTRALELASSAVKDLLARHGDPLACGAALDDLNDALRSHDARRIALAHAVYLHRLDAALTMEQKARGDAADILQTVRFQRELFGTVLAGRPGAGDVVERCRRFLAAAERRPVQASDYAALLRATLPDLEPLPGDLDGLQRAHLRHLWDLEDAAL